MNPPAVEIRAPSRIHFGLLSFGQSQGPQFGGVGLMLESPGVRLVITPSQQWEVVGPASDRCVEYARAWTSWSGFEGPLRCRIEVQQVPTPHSGLGSGTQMGLSIATGLNRFYGRADPNPCELARSVGRANRSTVGTFGFVHGGLIYENGKLAPDAVSSLECRAHVPEEWRVVLICPRRATGLWGIAEHRAFSKLPPVPRHVTATLRREVTERMLPAVMDAALDDFGESVYQYGRTAGMCFATVQGGRFSSRQQHDVVEELRSWGVQGVGQSSWGPTVFAFVGNTKDATDLIKDMRAKWSQNDYDMTLSRPDNTGVRVSDIEPASPF